MNKNCAVIFTRSNTIVSNLIRLFTFSNTSHCALLVPAQGKEEPVIYQACSGGVNCEPLAEFLSGDRTVSSIMLIPYDMTPGVEWFQREIGNKYDFRLDALDAIDIIESWFHLKQTGFKAVKNKFNCSEIVAFALTAANVPGAKDMTSTITPAGLMRWCKKNNFEDITVNLKISSSTQ